MKKNHLVNLEQQINTWQLFGREGGLKQSADAYRNIMQAFEAVSFILLFFQVVSNTTYLGTYFQQRSGPENGTNVRFLKETVALSLLDCVRQCLEYSGCQVQGFHKIQNTCYLVGDESLANVVVNMSVEDTAWVFYENTLYATNESENEVTH